MDKDMNFHEKVPEIQPRDDPFKFFPFNAGFVMNQTTELEILAQEINIDLIFIYESWKNTVYSDEL